MNKDKLIKEIVNNPEHINLLYTPEQSAMFSTVNRMTSPGLDAELFHVGDTVIFTMMTDLGLKIMSDWYETGADLTSLPRILNHITLNTVSPLLAVTINTEDCELIAYAISKEGEGRQLNSKTIEGISPLARIIINLATWQIESVPLDPDMFGVNVDSFGDEDTILHVIDGVDFEKHWSTSFGKVKGKYQHITTEEPTTLQ